MSNSSSTRTPAPFVFAASQYFEGPDGQWSSFMVRAGTPGQTFRVLPSTLTSETFLPMAGACNRFPGASVSRFLATSSSHRVADCSCAIRQIAPILAVLILTTEDQAMDSRRKIRRLPKALVPGMRSESIKLRREQSSATMPVDYTASIS